jgi:two-component sensor histidine kinase
MSGAPGTVAMSPTEDALVDCRGLVSPLILVEEISHRVINEYTHAIAEVRLAAGKTASAEARSVLISVADQLHRCADAHRALQAPAGDVSADLGKSLERLCAAVTAARLDHRGIALTLIPQAIRLRADRAWRVALIVSELITNAVRHGLQSRIGCIRVELTSVGQDVACRVGDNGKARIDAWPARGSSIVRGLAAELGGQVVWSFAPTGTVAELTFPLNHEEQAS